MSIKINLQNENLDDEDIQSLTREICQSINAETDASAELSSQEGLPGSKGDLSLIGEIILTAISSGAAVALINVVKSYINRNSSLAIDITGDNGKTVKINSVNVSSDKINSTISQIKSILNE